MQVERGDRILMAEDRCDGCKFFKGEGILGHVGRNLGLCCRYPPQVLYAPEMESIFPDTEWPLMHISEGCGEFVQRKPVTLKELGEGRGG